MEDSALGAGAADLPALPEGAGSPKQRQKRSVSSAAAEHTVVPSGLCAPPAAVSQQRGVLQAPAAASSCGWVPGALQLCQQDVCPERPLWRLDCRPVNGAVQARGPEAPGRRGMLSASSCLGVAGQAVRQQAGRRLGHVEHAR